MDMINRHYTELIRLALNKHAGWVPIGPLDAARRGRKLHYSRANLLADLEREGLVSITPNENGTTASIRLTDAGNAAIRAMPDDLHTDFYPLPVDIARAKAKLTGQDMHKW